MTTYKLNQFGAVIEKKLDDQFNAKVRQIMREIEIDLTRIDDLFFVLLSQKIVGQESFQGLGKYTPFWKPLSENYTDRRTSKKLSPNPTDKQFFQYSGRLHSQLSSLGDGETIFGTPIIKYKKGSFNSGDSQEITFSKNNSGKTVRKAVSSDNNTVAFNKIKKGLQARIEIRPFSKISSGKGTKTNIRLERFFTGKNKNLGYKLGNSWKAPNSRPVINPYLSWWMDVKVRKIVEKRTK